MKKLFASALAAAMLFTAGAMADTTINSTENRGITLQNVTVNQAVEGVSPTTGRTLSELTVPDGYAGLASTGRYMPILVQIDNAGGGVGYRAPWNMSYADIVYETPLAMTNRSAYAVETRISALFSDLIPDDAGPIRSARVGHASIREEWDCAFVRYGQQEYEHSNVMDFFKETGASKKGVLFNGTDGAKAWTPYFYSRSNLASPHDKGGNIAAMVGLVSDSFTAAEHTMLFTTEAAEGDAATEIALSWNSPEYNSTLVYDAATQQYSRYVSDSKTLYVDYDTSTPITFSNVIVQWVECNWPNVSAPIPQMVGEGNADIFMNGVHIAGYWKRADMSSRTVFYGADGNELQLQVGSTLISTMPQELNVSYK